VVGLEIGADDYVVKPFSPREVAARVKAILKRTKPATIENSQPKILTASVDKLQAFTIDNERLQIHYHQELLNLTRLEFRVLQTLIEHPQRVFSRDQLLTAAGISADAGYDRSIDTHIKTLRAKLRLIRPNAEPIQTQRGFGYSYQPEQL
jgi:two-component system catabolic regulation response regulator CreB